jgi:Ca2+-binding RTX toxin-like protein
MKKQILRILLLILILGALGIHLKNRGDVLGERVEAVGDLLFKYQDAKIDGAPLFVIDDFKPGDCVTRTVEVENNATTDSDVAVRSENESETGSLSTVLSMTIKEDATVLYEKGLNEFFADSDASDGVALSTVAGDGSTSYDFTVCFDTDAGNEFQGKSLQFDLVFGEIVPPPIPLPEICKDLEGIVTKKIVGTDGNDNIHGTTASELIIAKGGNDRIHPSSGSDCILAGDGDDRVIGTTGDEIIVGGKGNDRLDGGTGNDRIYGGEGEDRINGGSGNDTIYGGDGNDRLNGGSGNDVIRGGKGNDQIKGGSGDDELRGQAGDDQIYGQSDNDYLNGGTGSDILKGGSGTDTCIGGESNTHCESFTP